MSLAGPGLGSAWVGQPGYKSLVRGAEGGSLFLGPFQSEWGFPQCQGQCTAQLAFLWALQSLKERRPVPSPE